MPLQVEQFACRSDNFGVLIHDPASGETATIDAPETGPILAALERREWTITHILCTHHHPDHVAGNADLQAMGAELIGPAGEADRIAGLDRTVSGGNAFTVCNSRVEVIDTPGHTSGHVSYYLPDENLLFSADCLFSLGCGRLFEGTPAEMHASLQRLAALPGDTVIHCGHEYTAGNAAFALTIDPSNAALQRRAEEVRRLRAENRATLPVRLGDELATNPFLRPHDPAIRARLGMEEASDVEVFAELRRRKDRA